MQHCGVSLDVFRERGTLHQESDSGNGAVLHSLVEEALATLNPKAEGKGETGRKSGQSKKNGW